jgi:branched-chain amino acid transport system substrate-binding protein
MDRHWRWLAAVLVLVIVAAACSEDSSSGGSSSSGPIKIGAVLDVTGAGASLGGPERNTLQLLTEQLNAQGGINGRKIELTVLDNQSKEDEAAKAITRLINETKVDIVLGATRTGTSLAMVPTAEQAKMPMISLAANRKIVDGSKWVFKTAQNDSVVVEKLIAYMAKKGWKTVGLMRDASAFGEGVADLINQTGSSQGVKVVEETRFAPDATSFDEQILPLREARADVNLIWGIPPAAGLATKRYRELRVNTPLLQSHGVGNQAFLEAAGPAADGVVFPIGRLLVANQLPNSDPQKEVLTQFVENYRAKFGSPPSTFAGHAWDGFNLAVDAFKAVGTDKQKVRDHLEGRTGFVGISGVFNFTGDDHSGLDPKALVMVQVKDGKWTLAPDQV